ncbi:putative ribonuclease H-like domain-containing protein [Tanacetum coccineum]
MWPFVSTPSSTNEVNTANVQVSTANSTVSTNSTLDNDLEEMDLKWQLALLSIRAMMYYQRTRKKITINGSDTAGYDKSKVQCFNYHKMGHFARECKNPRNQESRPRNQDSSRRTVNVEDPSSKLCFEALKTQLDNLRVEFNKSEFNLATYKRGLASVEEQLVFYKKNEVIKGVGYNVVPPSPTGLFSPPTIDLSNSGLKEFQQPEFKGNGFKKNKGVCENSSSKIKGTGDAPIIEDWVSDCDEDESEGIVLKFDNSGIVPVNAARPINTVAPKSFVNIAKTRPNVFQKSHSLSRRSFYQQTTFKNRNLNDKVNTAKVNSVNTTKVNFVNTTKGNRVKSAIGEQGINVVKSSTCWVWRPKIKVLDHISKNSGSYSCKQFDYVDPTGRPQVSLELKGEDFDDSMNVLSVLVVHHTTNGHQLTMSNKQERIGHSKANGNWYALTANPTIYVSLIEQFWQTVTVDTVNDGEQQLTVIVDGQTIAITEASVRRHLQLADADGISSLPNTEIFDQLTLMGYVSNDDKLTFQKGVHIPLFDTMLIHDQPGQGEGPTLTVESQHTPIASPSTSQPTTSQPMSSQEQPSQVPITEPITDSFTTSHPTQTPSPMPHDSPLSGGHTPGSDEGSKKLNELMKLCTKLSIKVTSLEDDLKQTKKIYGKALTKLVKKVKQLEAKIKSTTERRKTKMVISDDEDDLVSENTSKQGIQERQSDTIKRYQTLKKKPVSVAQARKNMMIYLKNMAGYKMGYFKGMSYDEIRPIFEEEYNKIQTLFKKDTEVEKTKTKRIAEETLLQESFKKLRTAEASRSEPIQEQPTEELKELSEEELKKMLEIVLVEEFKVEALQVKYPIIDWEIHTEGLRKYWKIIRVRNITEAYQVFEDMLKGFDREDLRLFEPDKDDVMWKLQRYMYDPLTWRLYDTCGVHHVSSTRGHDIYMLIEKDYPLSTVVMNLMLSRRLQVEEDCEMARDLVMKIFIEANKLRI